MLSFGAHIRSTIRRTHMLLQDASSLRPWQILSSSVLEGKQVNLDRWTLLPYTSSSNSDHCERFCPGIDGMPA
jgi:hypothetical protein